MAAKQIATPPSGSGRNVPRWLMIVYGAFLLAFIAGGTLLGVFIGYAWNLPDIQKLEDFRPDVITDIYSDDSKVIGEFAVERRIIVTYPEIPANLQNALLAAEDDQFFHHSGVNLFAILRAAYQDIVTLSKAQGASTITQQLARMLLLSPEKQFDRKIKEILLAWRIEQRYTKRQILTLYCNQHYLGHGSYGFAAAADTYFGKTLQELSLAESALLAGLPRNPSMYSPRLKPASALSRRNYILQRMVAEGMLGEEAARQAKTEPIILKPRPRESRLAPYFVEWVRQSLSDRYSTEDIWRNGLRVYTTLNREMQEAANEALQKGLRKFDKAKGWRGPIDNIFKDPGQSLESFSHSEWRSSPQPGEVVTGLVTATTKNQVAVKIGSYTAVLSPDRIRWTGKRDPVEILEPGDLAAFEILSLDDKSRTAEVQLDQFPEVQGALITLDNATGEIKAMVGGYDFRRSEFNRATQARRQIGSTVKAIVYAAAFENGMSAEDTILDDEISFTDELGRAWTPRNYDGEFLGEVTIRDAVVESRNIPAIKVAALVGIKNIIVMARRFGFAGPMQPYLPFAIGACEATPLELASAYTVFPNLGQQAKPFFIRRIDDYDGVQIEQNAPSMRKVLDPEVAAQLLELFQAVVTEGTAKAALSLKRPVGGKTGTTNDYTDAWFVGFSPSTTTAVWVGHETNRSLGKRAVGGTVALPIWIEYMQKVLANQPVNQFPTIETTDRLVITEGLDAGSVKRKKLFVEDLPVPGGTGKP